MDQFPVEATD